MKLLLIPSLAITTALLFSTGCDGYRTTDYPDHSPDTTRKVDDIKHNARDQKDAIDQHYDQTSNNLDFRERQIHEKYKADRETYAVEAEKLKEDLDNRRQQIETDAKLQKDKIDTETAEKLKNRPGEEADAIKADATSRKAEIDSKATKNITPLLSDAQTKTADLTQRQLALEIKEAKEISDLNKERAQAREDMRKKKIEVDRWMIDELGKVDSASSVPKK